METVLEHLFTNNSSTRNGDAENPSKGTFGSRFMASPFTGNPVESVVPADRFQQFCLETLKRSSLDEKFQLVYNFLTWNKEFPTLGKKPAKCAFKAANFRAVGNIAFDAKGYHQALSLYTASVAVAPAQSEELAFAYANRSAVQFGAECFYECLLDVNRALQGNYPEAKKQKLRDRKKKCMEHFATEKEVAKLLPASLLDCLMGKGKEFFTEIMKTVTPDITERLDFPRLPVPRVSGKNKMIPNASEKIKLKSTRGNRVGVFATANIKPGEVLVVEKPVAWTLCPKFMHTHCAYCFLKTQALIPCLKCSTVMFCSKRCYQNALDEFHRIECQIFSSLPGDKVDELLERWVPVRLLLVMTKQGQILDQVMNQYKDPLEKTVCPNLKEAFDARSVSSVLHYGKLSSSNNFKEWNSDFDLSVFLTVVKSVYLLKSTSFFGEQGEKNQNLVGKLTKSELYVAALLLRCHQNDYFHVKDGKLLCTPTSNKELIIDTVGHGLFPLLNRFGHSCDPHVRVFNYDNNFVCRAVRPIKADEEILLAYVDPYHVTSKYARGLTLQQKYNLECTCRPCELSWPPMEKLPLTNQKVVFVPTGKRKFKEYSSRFQKLWDNQKDDELASSNTLEFLSEYMCMIEKRLDKPCQEFIKCDILITANLGLATTLNLNVED